MLRHVICDVCGLCIVLSEIGSLGNYDILGDTTSLRQCDLSYSTNLEKGIQCMRPVFCSTISTIKLNDYTWGIVEDF